MRRSAFVVAALLGCAATVSACDDTTKTTGRRPGTTVVGAECKRGNGKRIEQLPDFTVKSIDDKGVHFPTTTVGSLTLPAFDVPAVSIPAVTIDGGCIIRYDAPTGCLGAVEITPATIPGVTIPGYSYRRGGGSSGQDVSVNGMTASGTVLAGQKVERVCPPDGHPDAPIFRASVHRPSGYRAAVFRAGQPQDSVCSDNTCVTTPSVASLLVDAVTVPAVTVDAATHGVATGNATAKPDTGTTVFVGSTDVFFDVDKSELRPGAIASLRNIADQIRKAKTKGTITVEGHTDDTGTAEHNLALSTDRAEAVAQWLRTSGRLSGWRIVTKGYGETRPTAPNDTPAHRQANRRVVIEVG